MNTANAALQLHDDPQEFIAAAERWMPGLPFPLLCGPELTRYRSLFADAALPAVTAQVREGSVVSFGDAFARAMGLLLATATGRPHHHLGIDQLRDALTSRCGQLVALVGLADDLTELGDWPGIFGAVVGVITARSRTALACLVYRSLTTAVAQERVFIASHPMFRTSAEADAVDMAALAQVRVQRPKVLVLRGQGRECTFSLLDNMICGRSEVPTRSLPLVSGQRFTPCMHGEGCFRTDLEPQDLMLAHTVHAEIVFTHSCASIAVGVNAYPHDIALALGLLEGTAVAVIGALGVHVAQPVAQQNLEAALAAGLPLGEIVRRLEGEAFPLNGGLVRFGLLGDPALIVKWTDPGAISVGPPGTDRRPRSYEHEAMALLTRAHQLVIPRLERLRWLDLDVEERELLALRRRIRAAVRTPYDPVVAAEALAVTENLVELQYRTLSRLTEDIYTRGWVYGGPAFAGMKQIESEERVCSNCGRDCAAWLLTRHMVEESLYFQTLQCRRCGDIWWASTSERREIVLDGPVDVTGQRGGMVVIDRILANRGSEDRVGVAGFALRSRKLHGLPPGAVERCRVRAGGSTIFQAKLDMTTTRARADTHTMPFVALFDGVYLASMAMLRLT